MECVPTENAVSEEVRRFEISSKPDYLGKGGIGQRFFIYRREYLEFECV